MKKLLVLLHMQNGYITEKTQSLIQKIAEYIRSSAYTDVLLMTYAPSSTYCGHSTFCTVQGDQNVCKEIADLCTKIYANDTCDQLVPNLYINIKEGGYDEIHVCGMYPDNVVRFTRALLRSGFKAYIIPTLCMDVFGDYRFNEFTCNPLPPCIAMPESFVASEALYTLANLEHDVPLLMKVMERHRNYEKWFNENFPNGATNRDEVKAKV